MTPVSNNNDSHQPTGNLEELFRQKFAEAELTPRLDGWERLDHELLLRENQGYRRRLVGYRRLAAAACAVATLSIGTWFTQRNLQPAAPGSVAVAGQGAATTGAGANGRTSTGGKAATAADAGVAYGDVANGQRSASAATAGAADVAANAPTLLDRSGVSDAVAGLAGSASRAVTVFEVPADPVAKPGVAGRTMAAIRHVFGGKQALNGDMPDTGPDLQRRMRGAGRETYGVAAATTSPASASEAAALLSGWQFNGLQPMAAQLRGGKLAGRPDSLKASLASVPVLSADEASSAAEQKNAEKAGGQSRLRWRGGYTAERFAPNVSTATGKGIASNAPRRPAAADMFNSPPVPSTPTKLQAGLAQRGHLGVSIPLGKKRWTLLTGAELTVISGETVQDAPHQYRNYVPGRPLNDQPKSGRYRMTTAGVPVQLRYQSQTGKQGWGVYAAVGAAVNVLLRNRTEVDGNTATAADAYRRVLTSARGAAGVRFSPAGGRWQLAVGPEAEVGLATLNTAPAERRSERTRPYAVGLTASVEFGGGKPEIAH